MLVDDVVLFCSSVLVDDVALCCSSVLVDDVALCCSSVLVDDVALCCSSVFTPLLLSICVTRSVCVSTLDFVLISAKLAPVLTAICFNKLYLNASLLACSC